MERPLSRYFFHLRDGQDLLLDPEGREFPSHAAIAAAALLDARDIISHDAKEGHIKLDYHLDVEDDSGAVVHRLDFEDAVVVSRAAAKG
jgi:hypothetical protein